MSALSPSSSPSSSASSSCDHSSPPISSTSSPTSTPAKRPRSSAMDPERQARLAARQIRNRQSAQNSRNRKKAEQEALEVEVVELRERNTHLESKVSEMERGVTALMDLVKILMKHQTSPSTAAVQLPTVTAATASTAPSTPPPAASFSKVDASSLQNESLATLPPNVSPTAISAYQPVADGDFSPPRSPAADVDGSVRAQKRRKCTDEPTAPRADSHQGSSTEQPEQQLDGKEGGGCARDACKSESGQNSFWNAMASFDGLAQSAQTADVGEQSLLEANQKLATQLLEVMFGKDYAEADAQVASNLSPINPQIKSEATAEMPLFNDLTRREDAHAAVNILDDTVSLTPLSPQAMDEQSMADLAQASSELPSDTNLSQETQVSRDLWDYQALGLELGMDLSVDLDLTLDHNGDDNGDAVSMGLLLDFDAQAFDGSDATASMPSVDPNFLVEPLGL
ncbi:unnamed protein product [Parajaminaea phylloscopi]